MRVFVATPPKNQTGELQRLTLLFKIGLSTLHVRKPKLSAAEVDDYISSIPSKYHSRIIVHGNYPLVKKYGLKGYCIKRRHRSDKRKNLFQRLILRIRYPKKVVCASFKSIHSFRDSRKSTFDYVVLSNLMSIIPGKNLSVNNVKMINATIGKCEVPVLAQGGIDSSIAEQLKQAGFEGVILTSSVFETDEEKCVEEYTTFLNI